MPSSSFFYPQLPLVPPILPFSSLSQATMLAPALLMSRTVGRWEAQLHHKTQRCRKVRLQSVVAMESSLASPSLRIRGPNLTSRLIIEVRTPCPDLLTRSEYHVLICPCGLNIELICNRGTNITSRFVIEISISHHDFSSRPPM